MATFTFTHYIFITFPTFAPGTGGAISWDNGRDVENDVAVTDNDADGLDEGVDRWGTNATYSGRTVDVDGNIYALFHEPDDGTGDGDRLYIPYNKADQDIFPSLGTGGASTGYVPTGAQAFNCFATGTRIATPDGDRTVETIKPGDLVLTHDGRSTPVIWRAWQSVVNPRNLSVGRSPVRIEAGALGPDLPNAPLTVTADHALLFDDMLINAGTLVNGTTIRLLPLAGLPARFNYWHLELEKHECVVANGVPAESFIDYVGRSGFDNYDEYLEIAGADRLIKEMPFARISAHRLVPPELREALGIAPPSYMPRSKAA